jgi:hypothetical protein
MHDQLLDDGERIGQNLLMKERRCTNLPPKFSRSSEKWAEMMAQHVIWVISGIPSIPLILRYSKVFLSIWSESWLIQQNFMLHPFPDEVKNPQVVSVFLSTTLL